MSERQSVSDDTAPPGTSFWVVCQQCGERWYVRIAPGVQLDSDVRKALTVSSRCDPKGTAGQAPESSEPANRFPDDVTVYEQSRMTRLSLLAQERGIRDGMQPVFAKAPARVRT